MKRAKPRNLVFKNRKEKGILQNVSIVFFCLQKNQEEFYGNLQCKICERKKSILENDVAFLLG